MITNVQTSNRRTLAHCPFGTVTIFFQFGRTYLKAMQHAIIRLSIRNRSIVIWLDGYNGISGVLRGGMGGSATAGKMGWILRHGSGRLVTQNFHANPQERKETNDCFNVLLTVAVLRGYSVWRDVTWRYMQTDDKKKFYWQIEPNEPCASRRWYVGEWLQRKNRLGTCMTKVTGWANFIEDHTRYYFAWHWINWMYGIVSRLEAAEKLRYSVGESIVHEPIIGPQWRVQVTVISSNGFKRFFETCRRLIFTRSVRDILILSISQWVNQSLHQTINQSIDQAIT